MSTTPYIKFENSPANSITDSFASTPDTTYTSLFDSNHPMDDSMDSVMTPQSYEGEDSMFGGSIRGESVLEDTPAPEKKAVKKRKSWGQQLPEPKTNLPPRKRAKTEDEKEQRRVERVLRNRRAAQSSRERKRQEVEALEKEKQLIERRNHDLELRLAHQQDQILRLQKALENATGSKMHTFGSPPASSPPRELRRSPTPVTLSQDLFGCQDPHNTGISTQSLSDLQAAVQTVNPASLSPEIRPVADASNASSSDMTQHPAAMLCDLQCQSEEQRPWMVSTTPSTSIIYQTWVAMMMTSLAISEILHPLTQIIQSLKTMSTLSATSSNLTMIIRLVTMASWKRSTPSSSSSTTTHSPPSHGLRIRLLRRLLACSPHLARPLMDATMVAMRSASEQQLVHDCLSNVDVSVRREDGNSPGIERLMTLLWTIHVIERERKTQKTTKLDAATEVRQACDKLGNMFGHDHDDSFSSSLGAGGGDGLCEEHEVLGKKSLADWRMAFPKSS